MLPGFIVFEVLNYQKDLDGIEWQSLEMQYYNVQYYVKFSPMSVTGISHCLI